MSLKYMPTGFKDYIAKRTPYLNDIYTYVNCYPELERQALINNLRGAEWGMGYVRGVHEEFLSSGIGADVLDVISNKMIGMGVGICGEDEATQSFEEAFSKEAINNAIYDIADTMITYGSALSRLCQDSEKNYFIDVAPLGKFRVKMTQSRKIIETTTFLDYTSDKESKDKYVVMEKRYYKKGQPMMYYTIGRLYHSAMSLDSKSLKYSEYERKDIPEEIKKRFDTYEFNKEYPLKSLGVELFNATSKNKKFPSVWFGEAILVNAFDRLFSYDATFTASETDKNLGRGRVILPAYMNKTQASMDLATAVSIKKGGSSMGFTHRLRNDIPFDETFYNQVQGINNENQKPESVQFSLRINEWNEALDMSASQVASSVKIASCDLMARLSNGVQKTATEISFDTDITTSTITKLRRQMTKGLVSLFKDLASQMGIEIENLSIDWSMEGLSNQSLNNQLIINQYTNGLISKETALQKLYPSWSIQDVREELEKQEKEASVKSEDETLDF